MRSSILILSIGLSYACVGQQPGTLDTTFLPNDLGHGHGDGCDNEVLASALQPDGKVLIGGTFSNHNGSQRNRISRLNVDGTIDATFTPPTTIINGVQRIVVQPDDKILMGGYFTGCLLRLDPNGTIDGTFNTGSGFTAASFPNVYAIALQPDGKVLVGGSFTGYNGTAVSNVVRLNTNGTIDATFVSGSGINGAVFDILVQPDGKIVLVGAFTNYFGSRGRMVRLNANGSVDATFQSLPGADSNVLDIDLRTDGSFLISGGFNAIHSVPSAYRVARLLADGSVDATFVQTVVGGGSVRKVTEQADGNILIAGGWAGPFLYRVTPGGAPDPSFTTPNLPPVYTMAINDALVRPDGRIFISGPETRLGTRPFHHYTQLNADGSWDPTFGPGQSFNKGAQRSCRQPDGKTLVAGAFNSYFDTHTGGLVRLNVDGSLDTTFLAYWPSGQTNQQINQVLLRPDGKILVAGYFDAGVARLNSDGTPDPSFNAGSGNDWIEDMVLQPDGKIIITGGFTVFNGLPLSGIARLNDDGSVDMSFDTGTGLTPTSVQGWALALQPDGKVIVGGSFTGYDGTAVGRICRLLPTGELDITFQTGTGFNSEVRGLCRIPDGRVFVAGAFSYYDGQAASYCILLNPDGSRDSTFTPPAGVMYGNPRPLIHYDPIGKFLIRASGFTLPETAGGIARLNMNGSADPTFVTGSGFGSYGGAYDVEIEADSSYTIVGYFTSYDGVGRNRILRIKGGVSPKCAVQVRVLLGGPFIGASMSTTLSSIGLLPMTEPYTALGYPHVGGGGESVASSTSLAGITDWVVVELRDALDPTVVVATQSALLRSDGRVFSHTGFASLVFDVSHGNYFVTVHHRNHLGVMTASALALTDVPHLVDFVAPATATYGIEAQRLAGSRMVLWEGNATGDEELKYAGALNDRDAILMAIGGIDPFNTIAGYLREDVNLDGIVSYVGVGNDRDPIIANLPGQQPAAVRTEQVP